LPLLPPQKIDCNPRQKERGLELPAKTCKSKGGGFPFFGGGGFKGK